jgi:hypothetical protein
MINAGKGVVAVKGGKKLRQMSMPGMARQDQIRPRAT